MIIDRRIFFAGIAGFALAACSDVVGPPPAAKLYVLKPKLPGVVAGPPVPWALAVETPAADNGLDAERIAILRPPASLDFYAATAWADPLPRLVQASLVESFEASGRIAAVARDAEAAQSDYRLSIDIRDFEARYDLGDGAPLAVVRLGARLVAARTRKIAGYAAFAKEVRASANSIDAAVEALSSAYAEVLGDLLPWVLNRNAPG